MDYSKKEDGRKGKKGRPTRDITFRRRMALLYDTGEESLPQLSKRVGIPIQTLSRWFKEFSSELRVEPTEPTMTSQEQKDMDSLRKQLALLKQKLEHEQMRTFALETMLDLAKTELNIDVRKNFGAKQPKK